MLRRTRRNHPNYQRNDHRTPNVHRQISTRSKIWILESRKRLDLQKKEGKTKRHNEGDKKLWDYDQELPKYDWKYT